LKKWRGSFAFRRGLGGGDLIILRALANGTIEKKVNHAAKGRKLGGPREAERGEKAGPKKRVGETREGRLKEWLKRGGSVN